LESLEEPQSDANFVIALLNSLPDSYNNLVLFLESQENLTTTLVINRLIEEERKRNQNKDVHTTRMPHEKALLISNRNKLICKHCFKNYHEEKDCWIKYPEKYPPCAYCKRKGHKEKDCYIKYPEKNPRTAKKKETAKTLYAEVSTPTVEIATAFMMTTNRTGSKKDWYLDSAASDHYAIDRNSFATYTPLDKEMPVRVGNSEYVSALGIGTIYLKAKMNGWIKNIMVENVYYTPDLDCNLLSAGILLDQGCTVIMRSNKAKILKKNKLIATATKVGRLFRLNLDHNNNKDIIGSNNELCARIAILTNEEWKQNISTTKKQEDNNTSKKLNQIKPSRIPI
jgi:hypothetical protein